MRRVSSLALPAYLALAASTLSLQKDILCECAGSEDTFFLTLVPLEGRQTSSPGRHGRMYFGWFICGSNGKGGRRSSGTFGWAQNRQIFWFGGSSQLLWSGVAWSTQWDSFLKDLERRISAQSGDERECLPVPKVICCRSAIQRYLTPQQFWGGRPPGLMVIPAFTFS